MFPYTVAQTYPYPHTVAHCADIETACVALVQWHQEYRQWWNGRRGPSLIPADIFNADGLDYDTDGLTDDERELVDETLGAIVDALRGDVRRAS